VEWQEVGDACPLRGWLAMSTAQTIGIDKPSHHS
jgi:hypothetical protein